MPHKAQRFQVTTYCTAFENKILKLCTAVPPTSAMLMSQKSVSATNASDVFSEKWRVFLGGENHKALGTIFMSVDAAVLNELAAVPCVS